MTVSGLIDFGDMVYSYTVGDLAIAIAYVVLDKADPRGGRERSFNGYTSEFGLLDEELEAAVAARAFEVGDECLYRGISTTTAARE